MPLSLLAILGLIGILLMWRGQSRLVAQRESDPDLGALTELEGAGSDLTRAHQVEFFLYLPTRHGAEEIADQLRAEGYRVEVSEAEGPGEFVCLATIRIRPTLDDLHHRRNHLSTLAERYGGAYDGWGAEVVEAGEE